MLHRNLCLLTVVWALTSCHEHVRPIPDTATQSVKALQRLLAESGTPEDAWAALQKSLATHLAGATDLRSALDELEEHFAALLESPEDLRVLMEASQNLAGATFLDGPSLSATAGHSQLAQLSPDVETVVLFVNGIWNTALEAAVSRGALRAAVLKDERDPSRIAVGGYYNRSSKPDPEECVAVLTENGRTRLFRWILSKVDCIGRGVLNNLVPALRDGLAAVAANCDIPDESQLMDADNLASVLRAIEQQGKTVVVVAHSDGNNIVRLALDRLERLNPEVRANVGVVMVGSPLAPFRMPVVGSSAGGEGPRLGWVALDCDPVARIGAFVQCLAGGAIPSSKAELVSQALAVACSRRDLQPEFGSFISELRRLSLEDLANNVSGFDSCLDLGQA